MFHHHNLLASSNNCFIHPDDVSANSLTNQKSAIILMIAALSDSDIQATNCFHLATHGTNQVVIQLIIFNHNTTGALTIGFNTHLLACLQNHTVLSIHSLNLAILHQNIASYICRYSSQFKFVQNNLLKSSCHHTISDVFQLVTILQSLNDLKFIFLNIVSGQC
jgi:hypothetical protein